MRARERATWNRQSRQQGERPLGTLHTGSSRGARRGRKVKPRPRRVEAFFFRTMGGKPPGKKNKKRHHHSYSCAECDTPCGLWKDCKMHMQTCCPNRLLSKAGLQQLCCTCNECQHRKISFVAWALRTTGSQDYSHAEKKAANNMSDCPMEGKEETAPYPTYGRRSSQMEELFSDLPSQQAISNSSSPAVAASDPPSKMQKLNPP